MKYFTFLGLSFLIFSCSKKPKGLDKIQLTNHLKMELITEFSQMAEKDQRYRNLISYGTSNKDLIDSVKNLPILDQIKFKNSSTSEFSKIQEDSLWGLQNELDLKNTNRLFSIVKKYGWITELQLDSTVDPMIFLFHTPKKSIEKMKRTLFEEVQLKRMKPENFAMYVDNMRKKAFGKNQLYGTGDEFDSKTNSIVPPLIDNIDSTNSERRKLGLPILKVGEYRISK